MAVTAAIVVGLCELYQWAFGDPLTSVGSLFALIVGGWATLAGVAVGYRATRRYAYQVDAWEARQAGYYANRGKHTR